MSNLKDLLSSLGNDKSVDKDELEVYADSIRQGLDLAAKELQVDVSMLDYEVIEKGSAGLMGFGRTPYKLYIRPIEEEAFDDLNELDQKLSSNISAELAREFNDPNAPGNFKVRVTKSGIWFTVTAPQGSGKAVTISEVAQRFDQLQIKNFDEELVKKTTKIASGKAVHVGEYIPSISNDGTMFIEVSDDEMRAVAHFEPPRYSGRHMELEDVMHALKSAGVALGVDEKEISDYLESMNYSSPLVAARGVTPTNGNDAYVEYKVRVEKEISFDDDDDESVDFKDLNLIENVVVGQLLAIKIPATSGIEGRTVKNVVIPVKPGKDINIKHGEGTILSDDANELTAEKNGQVILKGDKICVDELLVIQGDVNNTTGNVVMMGSVLVTGNVLDEFSVKASGNIEVRGSVQKAVIEAEGDIIIRQGINGRDEGRIETTGGSVYAKFVNRANIIADRNIVVAEELLQSHVDAGNTVFCNGRRAQIVGGIIRAGDEVNAKEIGSDSNTKTIIYVGMNPKVLQQMEDMESNLASTGDELEKLELDLKTLNTRKKSSRLSEEQTEKLKQLTDRQEKLNKRRDDIKLEKEELEQYLEMIEHKGVVCAEKELHPGVEIIIKNERLPVNDSYASVSISMKDNEWKFGKYLAPEAVETMKSSSRRRR